MEQRKLTTIFYADVDGYTRMMARDEEATLAELNDVKRLMRQHFDKRDGKEINTWGDAVIAEFASVVEAVRCAVDIQETMESRAAIGNGDAMRLRIGINLGDVMVDEQSVYGDGVNQAARLEALCAPGGISVSETVYQLVQRQMSVRFAHMPATRAKPDEEPVAGYRVILDGESGEADAGLELTNSDPDPSGTAHSDRFPPTKINSAGAMSWFKRQPVFIKICVATIVFLFALNIVTTGLSPAWFLYPAIPLTFVIVLKSIISGR